MAHVQKKTRKSSRGSVTEYVVRYREPGGSRERSRTFHRKIDADRFSAEVEVDKSRGIWVDPVEGKVTVETWVARWLDAHRARLKPKTVLGYASLINSRIVPALGDVPLSVLRPSDVQAWINSMSELSPSRVRQAHVVLSEALEAAVRDNVVARNVARGVRLPRQQRREAPFFEPGVVERIASATPDPFDLFVRILGTLGPRYGEAAALRRRSVDLLRGRLVIAESLVDVGGRLVFGTPKSHARRSVPLPQSIAADLAERLERIPSDLDALLFTGDKGGPLRYDHFARKVWRPTLRELGLPAVGIHVLRHSAAARMISAGWSPKAVQTVLGHGSAAFTLTAYGHLFESDLDALAATLEIPRAGRMRDETVGALR